MTDQHPVRYVIPGMSEWNAIATDTANAEAKPDRGEALSSYLLASLQMQHVLVLTGLGTSLGAGGPNMMDLWNLCVGQDPSVAATAAMEALQYSATTKNIEDLLSRCEAQQQALGDVPVISAFLKESTRKILERCREVGVKGHDLAYHREFIRRLARRRARDPRLRLFTTNYDLCFEKAAGELGLTAIDGFSFTSRRQFDPRYFEHDIVRRGAASDGPNYVSGVFQYLKIHGSVDWSIDGDGRVTIDPHVAPEHACLIYPTQQKFQFSFRQPHLELMAQFLAALREPNTCLLVVGFGFNDAHLAEPILSALETNPHLRLLVVSPRSDQHYRGANGLWSRLRSAFERGHDVGFVRASFSEFVPLIPDLRVLTPGEKLERDIQHLMHKR